MRFVGLAFVILAACGSASEEEGGETSGPTPEGSSSPGAAGAASSDAPAAGQQSEPSPGFVPGGDSSDEEPGAPPATVPDAPELALAKTFAPHAHLHPSDPYRPANVDWYLKKTKLRYAHADPCGDHDVLALGQVTQDKLSTQKHAENEPLTISLSTPCRHDDSKQMLSSTGDGFYLELNDQTAFKGAARTEWKNYVVWRPHTKDANVDIEYWFFYPYNDGFTLFNHVSDWEHVRVTIDPKGNGGKGRLVQVKLSAHKGGTYLNAGDPNLELEGGTHPVNYVAKGTHANYPKPGTYEIEGTQGLAKDDAQKAAPADVWHTEETLVMVGTRAKPLNGQTFIKFWGRWGQPTPVPETSGVYRHFP